MHLHRLRLLPPGLASIFAAVLIWGAMPYLLVLAARELPPGEIMAVRMLTAGILFTAFTDRRRLLAALHDHAGTFVALSLFGVAIPGVLYIYALQTPMPIPVISFVTNSYPVVAILLAVLFLHERPSAYHLVGMTVAALGILLLAGLTGSATRRIPPGIGLALLASLGWASATVFSKPLTARVDTNSIVAGRHLLSGLLLFPVMLFQGMRLPVASPPTWLVMAVTVVLSAASYWFYYRGLVVTSVTSASVLETFGPVVTLAIGAVFFGQMLRPAQLAAAGLILAGTVLVSVSDLRQGAAAARTAAESVP
jgi:drug/metabolite transporter (DMT)-like permease